MERKYTTNKNPLEKIKKLNGVYFDWKQSKKHDIGLIAEDVAQVIPEVVSYEQDGKNAVGLDYGRLVAVTIEAIKAQQEEIKELKQEIEKLEAKVEK